jgi:hypothetical protein
MSYRIAGIDVHKKMLAVVVTDVEVEGEYEFARRRFGTTPDHLRWLSEWFVEQGVEEVVMESTAQYWKPVWRPRTILAAELQEAGRCQPHVRNPAQQLSPTHASLRSQPRS